MVIRINSENLKFENNKYYLDDSEFNGLCFFIEKHGQTRVYFCRDGVIEEKYKSKCLPFNENTLFVHDSYLEEISPNEPSSEVHYIGKPFNGIRYVFEQGYCVGETLYKDGWEESKVEYNLNSNYKHNIAYVSLNDKKNGLFQNFERYPNGNWKCIYINQKDSFTIFLKFSEEKEINVIELKGNFFSSVSKVSKKLIFTPYLTIESLEELSLGEWLLLKGEDINDDVFGIILSLSDIEKLKKVSIDRTSITVRSFNSIIDKLVALKELNFHPDLPIGVSKELLKELPKVMIKINN